MRRIAAVGVLAIAALVLVAIAAQARSGPTLSAASTSSFTASYTFAPAGAPVRMWVDDGGVQHVRGAPYTGTLSGGLTGTFMLVLNVNVDSTGSGDISGVVHIEVAEGTFDGRLSGDLTGGLAHGTFVAHSGVGPKMMGTFQDTAPGAGGIEGVILSPHG